MNTLDSLLPQLRSLLPASLRGEYLDGYLRRERTRMELLLSRSMPNVNVEASTFEDVRSEIRALGMPQWVANRYLAEAEQALAVGQDTREVVARAKAWMANRIADTTSPSADDRRYHVVVINERTGEKQIVSRPEEPLTHAEGVTFLSKMSDYPWRRKQLEEVDPSKAVGPDEGCHVCSETGKKSCTACGTEIVPYGAHGIACPKCAEQEIQAIDQGQNFTHGGSHITTTLHDVFEPDEPRSSAAKAAAMEPIDRFMAAYEPALYEALRKHPEEFSYTADEVPGFLPRWRQALLTEDFSHDGYAMRGACKRLGIKCTKQALIAFLRPKTKGPQGPYEMDEVDGAADQDAADQDAARAERSRMPKMQRLRAMLANPPSDLSGWSHRITELYDLRMRPMSKLFGSRGPTPAQKAEYDAEKKLWESLNRKAKAEHKRLLAASNAGLPPPLARPSRRPSLPDPVLTRSSGSAYRSEADMLADIFNEDGIWQAEATAPDMVGKWHAPGVRLSIFPEHLGPAQAVAVATIDDGEVEVEWLSDLTAAAHNEITRRLRTAALTHGEDSEAPSPLQDLIASTEKRALELGAKPARTRSLGRVTSENPEERWLGEAVCDLWDRSELDEAIKWLEDADLNLDFDIGERTLALDSVDTLMTEIWGSILDTEAIALGGVRGEGRGAERVFYVSPDMIFDANSMPFLMEHVKENSSVSLRQVFIDIIDPGDDSFSAAKVVDKQRVLTNDSRVHANERGGPFIRSLYRNMKSLRDDLSRAPKALDDVRTLLYWTGAMLDTPRCQDETYSRALESFEAAKVVYDQVRQHVVAHGTTSSELASIKAPLRKAAVSAAKLATDCGEGQVDIFSVRQPPAPLRQTAEASGMATRERYRQRVQAIGLPFDEENLLMTAVDRALLFGQDADAIIDRAREALHDASVRPRLPSPDEMPSRWMSGDHVVGPNGESGTIVRLEDRGEYGWHLKLDRPGAHWQSAVGFRRVPENSRHEPPPVPREGAQTPLNEMDAKSVDVLERMIAALSEIYIVFPIRSGHGYRVVDLRSKSTDGVFQGLPRNTYLTTVSLWNSKEPEFLGQKSYLVQSMRDAGRSQDQYFAIRRSMVENVERISREAQSEASEPAQPQVSAREQYRREILSLGLSFEREKEALSALDRAFVNGHDMEEVMRWARRPEPTREEPPPPAPPRPASPQHADPAKIADRVRKLLALAERAGTPEEAGTAYAQAQKLIAQHAISEEQLRQSRLGASTRSNEPIVSRIIYTSPVPQMPTWIGVLGMCLSETNGCEMAQSHGPNREVVLKAWGRASDLEIVEELLRVIPGQVDALCNRSPFSGRTAKNNFRIGAVTVICERMRAAVREARRAIQEDTSEHSATTTALALASLDNRGALAKAQMRRDVPNLKMKSTRHRGDAASFEAGRAAGASIGLSRQRSIR